MGLFFAPRLWASSDSVPDVLYRFDSYSQALLQLDKSAEKLTFLGVVGKAVSVENYAEYRHLNVVIFKKNFSGYIKIFLYLIRFTVREKNVISGDPYFTFWLLWLSKKLLARSFRIQISIHGIPLPGYKFRFFNLRHFGLRIASKKADSIRVVSEHLCDLLKNDWGVSRDRVFVAPIPVRIPSVRIESKREKQILILGRLHQERGVLRSIEIALQVMLKNPEVSLLLVGDGPLRSKVESIINQSNLSARIAMAGRLPHLEVLKKMSDSQVLLSSAPEEGFGLAIREAAYSGLFVVAQKNSGTVEAELELTPILSLYSTFSEAVSMCELALNSKLKPSTVDRIRRNREALNQDSLRKIAQSWL